MGQIEKRGTSGGECYGKYTTSTETGNGDGYTNTCIHSGSNSYTSGNTVWYNYALASAGTITGTDNIAVATESICPKGWTLPTKKQADNNTDIDIFSPVLGGMYYNSSLGADSTHGLWWVDIASNSALRYRLDYNGSLSTDNEGNGRNAGLYIRCVSEEKDVSDLTYMQDMTAKMVTNPKGWTLPSKAQIDSLSGGSGDETGGSSIYVPNFSPVIGGNYHGGALHAESTAGYWWGSTTSNSALRYSLYYNTSVLYTGNYNRNRGNYIRCIQAS